MKLLLDEMYPPALARALEAVGIPATTITDLGMNGAPDPEVFACAVAQHHVLLTENVADFVAIAAQHSTTGAHHPGLMIALSNRFTRRASGYRALVDAIRAPDADELTDRIVYLEAPTR